MAIMLSMEEGPVGPGIATDESGRSYVLEVNGAVDFNTTYADDVFAAAALALLERAERRPTFAARPA